MYYIGIDSGSTNTKLVLYQNEIVDVLSIPTSWSALKSAHKGLEELCDKHNLEKGDYQVTTTGYGRESINFNDYVLTEISAHALGGYHLNNNISGIIDIGGQDCKVIEVKKGKVTNFIMNDKCAAGTGSFLEMVTQKLAISFDMIDDFIEDDKYVDIVSMCAVFAQSEVVSLLANNVNRSHILLGVIVSISRRIEQLLAKINFNDTDTLLLTGGLASSSIVAQILEKESGIKVVNSNYSLFAGALGAAIYGKKQAEGVK